MSAAAPGAGPPNVVSGSGVISGSAYAQQQQAQQQQQQQEDEARAQQARLAQIRLQESEQSRPVTRQVTVEQNQPRTTPPDTSAQDIALFKSISYAASLKGETVNRLNTVREYDTGELKSASYTYTQTVREPSPVAINPASPSQLIAAPKLASSPSLSPSILPASKPQSVVPKSVSSYYEAPADFSYASPLAGSRGTGYTFEDNTRQLGGRTAIIVPHVIPNDPAIVAATKSVPISEQPIGLSKDPFQAFLAPFENFVSPIVTAVKNAPQIVPLIFGSPAEKGKAAAAVASSFVEQQKSFKPEVEGALFQRVVLPEVESHFSTVKDGYGEKLPLGTTPSVQTGSAFTDNFQQFGSKLSKEPPESITASLLASAILAAPDLVVKGLGFAGKLVQAAPEVSAYVSTLKNLNLKEPAPEVSKAYVDYERLNSLEKNYGPVFSKINDFEGSPISRESSTLSSTGKTEPVTTFQSGAIAIKEQRPLTESSVAQLEPSAFRQIPSRPVEVTATVSESVKIPIVSHTITPEPFVEFAPTGRSPLSNNLDLAAQGRETQAALGRLSPDLSEKPSLSTNVFQFKTTPSQGGIVTERTFSDLAGRDVLRTTDLTRQSTYENIFQIEERNAPRILDIAAANTSRARAQEENLPEEIRALRGKNTRISFREAPEHSLFPQFTTKRIDLGSSTKTSKIEFVPSDLVRGATVARVQQPEKVARLGSIYSEKAPSILGGLKQQAREAKVSQLIDQYGLKNISKILGRKREIKEPGELTTDDLNKFFETKEQKDLPNNLFKILPISGRKPFVKQKGEPVPVRSRSGTISELIKPSAETGLKNQTKEELKTRDLGIGILSGVVNPKSFGGSKTIDALKAAARQDAFYSSLSLPGQESKSSNALVSRSGTQELLSRDTTAGVISDISTGIAAGRVGTFDLLGEEQLKSSAQASASVFNLPATPSPAATFPSFKFPSFAVPTFSDFGNGRLKPPGLGGKKKRGTRGKSGKYRAIPVNYKASSVLLAILGGGSPLAVGFEKSFGNEY